MLTAQCYAPCHGLDVLRLSALVPEGVASESASRRAVLLRMGRSRDAGQEQWLSRSNRFAGLTFLGQQGYGFISRDAGEDVFIHYSAIEGEGFRSLNEGQRVEFAVEQTPKGLQAVHVRAL